MKTEHPILFSTPMVQAILREGKTQTRRMVKTPKGAFGFMIAKNSIGNITALYGYDENERTERSDGREWLIQCPYGHIGDILWVRETWNENFFTVDHTMREQHEYQYKADGYGDKKMKWKPSIFMPREACRIRLEITNIRVERLQNISEEDAIAEGVEIVKSPDGYFKNYYGRKGFSTARDSYISLWNKINGNGSWDNNPWVWIIEFKRI